MKVTPFHQIKTGIILTLCFQLAIPSSLLTPLSSIAEEQITSEETLQIESLAKHSYELTKQISFALRKTQNPQNPLWDDFREKPPTHEMPTQAELLELHALFKQHHNEIQQTLNRYSSSSTYQREIVFYTKSYFELLRDFITILAINSSPLIENWKSNFQLLVPSKFLDEANGLSTPVTSVFKSNFSLFNVNENSADNTVTLTLSHSAILGAEVAKLISQPDNEEALLTMIQVLADRQLKKNYSEINQLLGNSHLPIPKTPNTLIQKIPSLKHIDEIFEEEDLYTNERMLRIQLIQTAKEIISELPTFIEESDLSLSQEILNVFEYTNGDSTEKLNEILSGSEKQDSFLFFSQYLQNHPVTFYNRSTETQIKTLIELIYKSKREIVIKKAESLRSEGILYLDENNKEKLRKLDQIFDERYTELTLNLKSNDATINTWIKSALELMRKNSEQDLLDSVSNKIYKTSLELHDTINKKLTDESVQIEHFFTANLIEKVVQEFGISEMLKLILMTLQSAQNYADAKEKLFDIIRKTTDDSLFENGYPSFEELIKFISNADQRMDLKLEEDAENESVPNKDLDEWFRNAKISKIKDLNTLVYTSKLLGIFEAFEKENEPTLKELIQFSSITDLHSFVTSHGKDIKVDSNEKSQIEYYHQTLKSHLYNQLPILTHEVPYRSYNYTRISNIPHAELVTDPEELKHAIESGKLSKYMGTIESRQRSVYKYPISKDRSIFEIAYLIQTSRQHQNLNEEEKNELFKSYLITAFKSVQENILKSIQYIGKANSMEEISLILHRSKLMQLLLEAFPLFKELASNELKKIQQPNFFDILSERFHHGTGVKLGYGAAKMDIMWIAIMYPIVTRLGALPLRLLSKLPIISKLFHHSSNQTVIRKSRVPFSNNTVVATRKVKNSKRWFKRFGSFYFLLLEHSVSPFVNSLSKIIMRTWMLELAYRGYNIYGDLRTQTHSLEDYYLSTAFSPLVDFESYQEASNLYKGKSNSFMLEAGIIFIIELFVRGAIVTQWVRSAKAKITIKATGKNPAESMQQTISDLKAFSTLSTEKLKSIGFSDDIAHRLGINPKVLLSNEEELMLQNILTLERIARRAERIRNKLREQLPHPEAEAFIKSHQLDIPDWHKVNYSKVTSMFKNKLQYVEEQIQIARTKGYSDRILTNVKATESYWDLSRLRLNFNEIFLTLKSAEHQKTLYSKLKKLLEEEYVLAGKANEIGSHTFNSEFNQIFLFTHSTQINTAVSAFRHLEERARRGNIVPFEQVASHASRSQEVGLFMSLRSSGMGGR